jgi:hypothetical protein
LKPSPYNLSPSGFDRLRISHDHSPQRVLLPRSVITQIDLDAEFVRPFLKRLFTSRDPTSIGSRIDLIDDLEVGEKLPRRELFDFLLV